MSNLQNRMYEFEVTPPAGVWQKISTEMNHPAIHSNNRQSTKIRHFSFTLVAASMLLFIICTVFFEIQPNTSKEPTNTFFETGYRIAPESDGVLSMDKNSTVSSNKPYILLEGPHGKVKVSRKVAAIFVTPEASSKAQWIKKLDHWKNIMMTASNTDFMDVIPLTQGSETEH